MPRMIRLGLATAMLILIANLALATDSAWRVAQAAQARATGLGEQTIALPKRLPGNGAANTLVRLHDRLSRSDSAISIRGTFSIDTQEQRSRMTGDGWHLTVFADGSHVSYRNHKYPRTLAQREPRPRIGQEPLARRGMSFVEDELDGLIELRDNERIEPLHSQVPFGPATPASARDADAPVRPRTSVVMLTRTVDGVAVIGPGSKIAVYFASDGEPVGFDYDWARYAATGQHQQPVSVPRIHSRLGALMMASASGAAGMDLARFECGLYDAGAGTQGADAPLQLACFAQFDASPRADLLSDATQAEWGGVPAARVLTVPVARDILPDPDWPEAMTLLGMSLADRSGAADDTLD